MSLIDGFVLAGGQSRRMGQDKAALLVGGRTLIDRAAGAMFSIANTVYLVGNSNDAITSLPIIQDHPIMRDARGAIVGLYTACERQNRVDSRTRVRPAICHWRIDDSDGRHFAALPRLGNESY
ncbi:MAG: NTP transferase domain-containing protein [Acidobacteria bacterium]|nr:NTP transferase domain-containing protein [Acidobacteriota bacterium]